jgi:hypothetical protein
VYRGCIVGVCVGVFWVYVGCMLGCMLGCILGVCLGVCGCIAAGLSMRFVKNVLTNKRVCFNALHWCKDVVNMLLIIVGRTNHYHGVFFFYSRSVCTRVHSDYC